MSLSVPESFSVRLSVTLSPIVRASINSCGCPLISITASTVSLLPEPPTFPPKNLHFFLFLLLSSPPAFVPAFSVLLYGCQSFEATPFSESVPRSPAPAISWLLFSHPPCGSWLLPSSFPHTACVLHGVSPLPPSVLPFPPFSPLSASV